MGIIVIVMGLQLESDTKMQKLLSLSVESLGQPLIPLEVQLICIILGSVSILIGIIGLVGVRRRVRSALICAIILTALCGLLSFAIGYLAPSGCKKESSSKSSSGSRSRRNRWLQEAFSKYCTDE